jgi:methionine biosynthesis protein MetW
MLSYEEYWEWRKPSHIAPRHRIFASWIPDGSQVLDVACGDGAFAQYLHEMKGCRVTGIDMSETAVEKTKKRGLEAYVMDVVHETPQESFDTVVLSAFIEHVVNSEEVLLRFLTLADQVLLSIPNIGYIEHRIRLFFGHFPCQWAFHPSEHVRFWTVADFCAELSQMGVQVLECCADDGIPLLKKVWMNLFGEDVCFRLAGKNKRHNSGKSF